MGRGQTGACGCRTLCNIAISIITTMNNIDTINIDTILITTIIITNGQLHVEVEHYLRLHQHFD